MSPWIMKEQPLRNKMLLCILNQVLLCWLSSHTYFSQLLSILRVWLLFFPCLIIPVIIHDRTSALKRSASKLIKWNDSLMSALWRDGYEQASILDEPATSALTSSGIDERSRLNTLHNVLNHLSLSHRMCEINTQYPDITWMNVHVYDNACVLK